MPDDQKRPAPPLIDENKGKLVEQPGRTQPTPAELNVKQAEKDLNDEGNSRS